MFSTCQALLDCEWSAQAAQAAHTCCFKPLKLTKARGEPYWSRQRKEDPVLFMALYKADYMYTIRQQLHGALQEDYRNNLKWTKARATPQLVRK